MNKKTLFLVITLTAMLILVTSVNAATDNTNTSTTHSISEKTTTEPVVKEKIENTQSPEKQATTKKEINKKNKTKENTKKDPTTIEVYDTTTLTNALTTIQNDQTNDEFIINFNEGNYDFGSNNIAFRAAKIYTLNGNNQTLKAQMFSCSGNNVKGINVMNLNCETTLSFALASLTGTGKLINSHIKTPSLTLNCPSIIIDETTTIDPDFLTTISRNAKTDATIYTNSSDIISKFLELGVPEDRILSGSSNNDNILIENVNITESKSFNGNNITLTKSNITAPINTIGNIYITNCQINAKITNTGNLTLINCSLSNNNLTTTSSKTDGFLIENRENLTMIDCRVENNTFNTSASNTMDLYGAIVNNGSMSVENCVFNNNKIGYYIKELTSYTNDRMCGNAPTITNAGRLKINNSKFSNNFAGYRGGAIQSLNNELYINNSQFTNNHAILLGGAISIGEPLKTATFKIENSLFTNNSASNDMTGGYADTVYMTAEGGAIYVFSANGTINNSTFKNNKNSTIRCGYETNPNNYHIINITNNIFEENNATVLTNYYNTYFNIINNQFINNTNTTSVIYNSAADAGHTWTEYKYQEQMINNTFKDNNVTTDTIRYSSQTWGSDVTKTYNKTLTKNTNTYINTTINDEIKLKIPQKIYTGEPITITGTYTINTPKYYDPDILDQNKFNIYINGELNQTSDTLEFTITPTNGTMRVTVQPTISQTRKTEAIRATTLTDIIITPENYNEYIYEGNLIGVSKDTKILFQGTFTNKGEVFINTPDIVLDGSNATFTNTMFTLEASGITLRNMNIENNNTKYPITNTKDNNIITGNTIKLNNTSGKTAAIYNTASNTEISSNTLLVDGPALGIDYTSGLGVANTRAILLLGGDNNIVEYNDIHVTSSGTSGVYGTVEAITNHDHATNTKIQYNTIRTDGNGRFNYAINSLANVENITINYNNIFVTGERYAAGIQVGNGAENIILDNNNIEIVCQNTTPVDEEAITYGIVTTNMGSGISNNINITNNNIDLTGNVNYGIEVYQTTNTIVDNNVINVKGPQSMGIGLAHSPNSTITNNKITTEGDSTIPLTQVTEEIKQANVGIQIQQDSNNILIQDNSIQTYDVGAEDKCINIETSNVTIKDNNLTSSTKTGENTITTTQPDTILDNNNAIEQESTTQTTTENLTLGENTTLTAQFYDDTYIPISDGKAIFKVNGKTLRDDTGKVIYVDVINGRAKLPDVNITQEWMKPGTTIQAIYVGDNNNEPITTEPTTVTVTKPEASITLYTPQEAVAGAKITLKTTITNGDTPITSGRVAFKLNGKTLKDTEGKALYAEVKDGIATIEYTIPEKTKAKEYKLTAVFTDTQYDRVDAEATLNVVKA